ncbi:hypothetical protein SAMN06264364_12347 [Quadrisphaera granulorum]|uniref:Uncharacterized protein n=1 Tax=Quadrisphaera granulorum TaxID=317664 RepID=A0A316AJU1_9ACTN|nr:hypothetical protein BXY45_12347 [Quadrisphaera granulorum]SZE98003.1 hypothetical protein SAMN06264364_12347 [Quadrisphaera granulorum]
MRVLQAADLLTADLLTFDRPFRLVSPTGTVVHS